MCVCDLREPSEIVILTRQKIIQRSRACGWAITTFLCLSIIFAYRRLPLASW